MKRAFLIISLMAGIAFLLAFTGGNPGNDDINWGDCVEKYNSKWGEPCGSECGVYGDSYTVFIRNICDQNIDLQLSVQDKNKKWNTYYKENMAPQDTLSGCACKGTGKYMTWVRKAGDKQVTFPNQWEVNSLYKE